MAKVTTLHRANGRKRARQMRARGHAARMRNLKRSREPRIPAEILKALAKLNLPRNPWVYSVCLRELLRSAAHAA
jgi:hypothetical protein